MFRCFKMILVLIVLAGFPAVTTAAAGDIQYRLDALDLTVNVPEDFTVLTRDSDPNDPAIARLGLNGTTLGDFLVSKNIYLYGISADKVSEFLVIIPETSLSKSYPDFRLYSDDALRRNSGDIVAELKSQGAGEIAVDVYGNAQAKYLKVRFIRTTTPVDCYREMYCTVISGKLVMLALDSSGQPPSETQQELLKHIIDGLVFGK